MGGSLGNVGHVTDERNTSLPPARLGTSHGLRQLAAEFPAWDFTEDSRGAVTASAEGARSITCPSAAVMRVTLDNERWKHRTGRCRYVPGTS
jgi:hypothetical protein